MLLLARLEILFVCLIVAVGLFFLGVLMPMSIYDIWANSTIETLILWCMGVLVPTYIGLIVVLWLRRKPQQSDDV